MVVVAVVREVGVMVVVEEVVVVVGRLVGVLVVVEAVVGGAILVAVVIGDWEGWRAEVCLHVTVVQGG